MNSTEAKTKLQKFLGDEVLTFSVKRYPNGEWVAECNEIPAIMTGGMGDDIAEIDTMMREAILTAAGIDTAHSHEVLKLVGYDSKLTPLNYLLPLNREKNERKAEYALT